MLIFSQGGRFLFYKTHQLVRQAAKERGIPVVFTEENANEQDKATPAKQ